MHTSLIQCICTNIGDMLMKLFCHQYWAVISVWRKWKCARY